MDASRLDPYALPCHPELSVSEDHRGWKGVGLDPADGVTRLQLRCATCKRHYNAFRRIFGDTFTVEWVALRPFAVAAVPVDDAAAPAWQDAREPLGHSDFELATEEGRAWSREQAPSDGPWEGAATLVSFVQPLMVLGQVVAVPGDLLVEARRPWVANDRRLALLWSPRLSRPVVAWHSFARLPDR